MWGGLGQVFGASRQFTTHGITIANGVHDIVPRLSFPGIVTNFGTREVVLRQRANFGYVELLTTGVVQVPHAATPGAAAILAFATPTTMEGVVGAVSGARGFPGPGRDPGLAALAEGAPATPARRQDPGEGGPLPGAAQPVAPVHIKATQHRIELNDGARPVRFAPRRAGPTAREAETAEVKRQLEADVIEPTSSKWGFSVVLVPKKDRTVRFCVAYRPLNVVTRKDSYPLRRMDECSDSLWEATIFSTLACNAGYL